jgi:hypothetical protein
MKKLILLAALLMAGHAAAQEKVGEMVYPFTVLGKTAENNGVRVSVFWRTAPQVRSVLDFRRVTTHPLAPVFLTAEGAEQLVSGNSYEAAATDKLITEEMTKREIKTNLKAK